MSNEQVAPHEFTPLRWRDRFGAKGRCYHCYFPKWTHPQSGWSRARPYNDHGMRRTSLEDALALEFKDPSSSPT